MMSHLADNCPLDRVLTYKKLIYLLNLQNYIVLPDSKITTQGCQLLVNRNGTGKFTLLLTD